ncbi:hypothetical protein LGQ02_18045 [Bacillus shivajii]|uniref:hypothetical protein n=1 Tax=Bacillus shivajii TaxID=1983719 RepID=UPI001CFBF38B|nr:hypothetical protein [Bacillus shivajii]UCZ52687.1 hypothetical protein LGQ02_18045 [Bacillus shivajii]
MEKYIDVMKQSVDLSQTILEGLQHIQKLQGEGKFEETMYLFEDVVAGFSSVEKSMQPLLKELNNDELEARMNSVKIALDLVVSSYESNNYGKVQEIMQFTLVPQFMKLKQELERTFETYLLS